MLSLNWQKQDADDLVLMIEIIEALRNRLSQWKQAFEGKGLKVNLGKTEMMISVCTTKNGLSNSQVYQCEVYGHRARANSALCV